MCAGAVIPSKIPIPARAGGIFPPKKTIPALAGLPMLAEKSLQNSHDHYQQMQKFLSHNFASLLAENLLHR